MKVNFECVCDNCGTTLDYLFVFDDDGDDCDLLINVVPCRTCIKAIEAEASDDG